jgi:PhzF family phenazine biosynthesis protein
MNLPIYKVDAFTDRLFAGNPAAVVPLETWLADGLMQDIAAENNLSETAFYVRGPEGFAIRWFTPAVEVDLCGHATLGSAFVAFSRGDAAGDWMEFSSRSGPLRVRREGDFLVLDFPAHVPEPAPSPDGLAEALGAAPREIWRGGTDYLLVFDREADVQRLEPDFARLAAVPARGLIATAPGTDADFVSRFFAPRVGVPEDPVTGSSHTRLTPYWTRRLGKAELTARQLSRRGGTLRCRMAGDRVEIAGQARLYLTGTITV